MSAALSLAIAARPGVEANIWDACRFLSCSVLPVRLACNLRCPFCFSKSSVSALREDRVDWPAQSGELFRVRSKPRRESPGDHQAIRAAA